MAARSSPSPPIWVRGEELEPARAKGGTAGHQARKHPYRRCARGIRARLRLPDVPRQCALRGALPAGHLDCAAADLQASGSISPMRIGPMPSPMAPPARATIRCAFELSAYALDPSIRVIAPWREWDLTSPHQADRVCRGQPDPDRQGQARRGALQRRCESAAYLKRGQGAGKPGRGSPRLCLSAHRQPPRMRPTPPNISR